MADRDRESEPAITLARDEFTVERRRLEGHPEGVAASSRIDVVDDYGNVTTWVLDLFRLDGAVTAFVQRGARDGYIRLVIPPAVTSAIARHSAGLISKARRKLARRAVADLRAQSGEVVDESARKRRRRRR